MLNLGIKIMLDNKIRSLFTFVGVGFAVSLVCIQGGMLLGLLDNASCTIDHAGADLWITARNTPNVDFANTFPEAYVNRVRSLPEVDRADNLIVWFVPIALPSGAKESTQMYAMEDFRSWNLPWNLEVGDVTNLRRSRAIILDASSTGRYGPFEVGQYRELGGVRLQIIGRSREAQSFTTTPIAFLDYQIAQELIPSELRNRTTYILVKLRPGADRKAVQDRLKKLLPFNSVLTREDWAARSKKYWLTRTGLGMSMGLTVFLGCLVGVVIVGQTLYTSTLEHTREFGTVKAIGGTNASICAIVAQQAGVAALVGFVLGVSISLTVRLAMTHFGLKLILPLAQIGWVFVGTVVLCLLASVLSFGRVASLDPRSSFASNVKSRPRGPSMQGVDILCREIEHATDLAGNAGRFPVGCDSGDWSGQVVRDRTGNRPCRPWDFALGAPG